MGEGAAGSDGHNCELRRELQTIFAGAVYEDAKSVKVRACVLSAGEIWQSSQVKSSQE